MGKKTDARIEKLIIEMYKAGIAPRNISTALGVTTSTVHSIRERTGIPVQNPNRQAGAIKAAKSRCAKLKSLMRCKRRTETQTRLNKRQMHKPYLIYSHNRKPQKAKANIQKKPPLSKKRQRPRRGFYIA